MAVAEQASGGTVVQRITRGGGNLSVRCHLALWNRENHFAHRIVASGLRTRGLLQNLAAQRHLSIFASPRPVAT